MTHRRFLPEYVTAFKDRHGKQRVRFRRKGYVSHYFRAALGTEAFREEYRTCLDGLPNLVSAAAERARPGSVDDVVMRYVSVLSRLGPTPTTQAKILRIIDGFRVGRGHRMVADVRFEHIEAIVAATMVQSGTGNRKVGGIEAARKLRKELIRFFDFAVKIEVCQTNPARLSQPVRVARGERSKGFHTWTEIEIAQFRNFHALGTRSRLAMELMLWTCQRRIDAIRLGRQHIRDGRFHVAQSKTGTTLQLLIAPQLLEAIVAVTPPPPGQISAMTFLLTDHGKPYTNAGFGNWFRVQCTAAGLPQCTAHGLRKATMRRAAELNSSNQSLKSLSGHSGDNEVACYTRAAEQKHLADAAIRALAAWEAGLPVADHNKRLDIDIG